MPKTRHDTTDHTLVGDAHDVAPLVRQHADGGEQGRRLPEELVRAFAGAGMWRSLLPDALGGLEVDLATFLRAVEVLSEADGSAGWCAMIGATGGLIGAFLQEPVAREIFAGPRTVVGGTVNPAQGRADVVDGGVSVTGRWTFASGCQHSDWMVVGAVVFEDGERKMSDRGPVWRLWAVPAQDITIHDTWRTAGLRGTGSHDIEVRGAVVPWERSVDVVASEPRHDGTLYRIPLRTTLHVAVAAAPLGIARRAIDELTTLAGAKRPTGAPSSLATRGSAQIAVAEAEADLRSARAYLYDEVAKIWEKAESGAPLELTDLIGLRLAVVHTGTQAARAVDRCYTAAGGTALYETSVLQRCFRDVHAATQHVSVAPHNYETIGRAFFGLPVEPSSL